MTKLALGTAQFGLDYGVSNAGGRVDAESVDRILGLAARHNLEILDTAQGYGDSQAVLGRALPRDHEFRIVTKTPGWLGKPPKDAGQRVIDALEESRRLLNNPDRLSLLAHHADDLVAAGGDDIVAALHELKRIGQIDALGVSVYDRRQIDAVMELFKPDIVQIPLNLFDQRLIADGTLEELRRRDIEVHVRSCFLQGLILMPEKALPETLKAAAPAIKRLVAFTLEHGMSRLQAAISYLHSLSGIDHIIIGVTRAAELAEIIAAFNNSPHPDLPWASLAMDDENILDPTNWRLQ